MFVVKGDVGHKRVQPHATEVMGPRFREDDTEFVATSAKPYASPSVSNIAALIASAAHLPAQTTNWNAG
jgi:hypothetical protein